MKKLLYILIFIFFSCSPDIDDELVENTLAAAIAAKEIVIDNVIACAASNDDSDLVSIFLYPRVGVTNIQYYETESSDVDKNDYTEYAQGNAPLLDVFNGFLLKFEASVTKEKWVIVSFEEEGKTHLSNPIRLKQQEKPTEYINENISIDKTEALMPKFSWEDGIYDDTKIYFEVISDAQNNFISGTYTFEKEFQYYKLDNVVLNITDGTPPELANGNTYNFTLLAVSEDNWVNLFSEVVFNVE